jgi:hypothetical protein
MTGNNNNAAFNITPETKVGALLDNYPDIEELLISLSPSFKKLRNPVLRKTVAKVANLRQVAQVENIPLAELINKLRKAAGLDLVDSDEIEGSSCGSTRPEWVQKMKVVETFDAGSLIDSGGFPLHEINPKLKEMKEGEMFLLITPFLPAPMLDAMKKQGYQCWSTEEKGQHKTYIGK